MSLLEDLNTVAAATAPHETPPPATAAVTLGALIKALEHTGFTVAEDLLDTAEPELAPVVNDTAPVVDHEFDELKARLAKFLNEHGA